jgi:hypothetical protein
MSDDSSTAVADPRVPPSRGGRGVCAAGSDVERTRKSAAPTVADLADATARAFFAAVAFAAIHDDRDVGIVLVTLDEAGIDLFAEFGRDD